MAIVACLETNYDFRHHAMLQSLALIPFFKVSFASRILYQLVLWFTKMDVCIFYRRVFQDTKSKLFINLALGFLVATGILIMLLNLLQYIPIEGNWNLKPGKCMPYLIYVYVTSICNILADIVLLAFAIPHISKSFPLSTRPYVDSLLPAPRQSRRR
jgi:hypothetical protein